METFGQWNLGINQIIYFVYIWMFFYTMHVCCVKKVSRETIDLSKKKVQTLC